MSLLPGLDNAWIAIQDGKIASFGDMNSLPPSPSTRWSAGGGFAMPAWIDCHTHLVFADWRSQEFVDRINGMSYHEMSERGGGILNSAKNLALLSEDELFERSLERLQDVIRSGTGAIEIKSGYGLDTMQELKILRVIRRLKEQNLIPIKATFLGAHSYPMEFRSDHQGYLDQIILDMLPQIAAEGLADYCDVFCEKGFFSPEESEKILSAADRLGIKSRIHTNQFTHSGGIKLAIDHQAISVDHLEVLDDEEMQLLAQSQTIPVLLPTAAFFMNQEYPPARKMIAAGLGPALASDFNPGTSPSYKMSFVFSLACIQMKMNPEEALAAATINAAYALELQHELGSISPGKMANIIITKPCSGLDYLAYKFTDDWLAELFIQGIPRFS
ncbi:MAG: imidazolonepropionase [Bacteroidota bacterium]|nr:imidazolonepropionase [Bacteroidota bacterium]